MSDQADFFNRLTVPPQLQTEGLGFVRNVAFLEELALRVSKFVRGESQSAIVIGSEKSGFFQARKTMKEDVQSLAEMTRASPASLASCELIRPVD